MLTSMLMTVATTAMLAFQDVPPGQWDPTDPEDVARRTQDPAGSSGKSDPLKGPDVPEAAETAGQRGGQRAGQGGGMQMTVTVESLLSTNCASCHGTDKQKGGLQILPLERLHEGPEKFRVVKAGDPASSLLLTRIKLPAGHDDVMPPSGETMSAPQIKAIEDWIKGGATVEAARKPIEGMQPAGAGRNRTSARDFLRAYMDLKDLTPEQRKAGVDAATAARRSLSNEDKAALKELQEMQRKMAQGEVLPAELAAKRQELRSKAQELQAKAAKAKEALWAKLTTEQQTRLRAILDERAKAKQGARRGQRGGRPNGPAKGDN